MRHEPRPGNIDKLPHKIAAASLVAALALAACSSDRDKVQEKATTVPTTQAENLNATFESLVETEGFEAAIKTFRVHLAAKTTQLVNKHAKEYTSNKNGQESSLIISKLANAGVNEDDITFSLQDSNDGTSTSALLRINHQAAGPSVYFSQKVTKIADGGIISQFDLQSGTIGVTEVNLKLGAQEGSYMRFKDGHFDTSKGLLQDGAAAAQMESGFRTVMDFVDDVAKQVAGS